MFLELKERLESTEVELFHKKKITLGNKLEKSGIEVGEDEQEVEKHERNIATVGWARGKKKSSASCFMGRHQ
ncbi:unnamed protein product [Victoria cruziana]